MARKEANLNNILFSQDFLPEHWNWTDVEKAHLGNVAEMGEIIKTRLENGGCEIEEMYEFCMIKTKVNSGMNIL